MAKILDIAKFANDTYKHNPNLDLFTNKEFINLKVSFDDSTGFHATSYYNPNTKEVVIAYTGTNGISDVNDDGKLALRLSTEQTPEAIKFLETTNTEIKNTYGLELKNTNVTITGHSLGGYLAQKVIQDVLSKGTINKENLVAVIFNSPRTGEKVEHSKNIVSISDNNDSVNAVGGSKITDNIMEVNSGTNDFYVSHKMDTMIKYLEEHPSIGLFTVKYLNELTDNEKQQFLNNPEDFILNYEDSDSKVGKLIREAVKDYAKLETELNNQKAVNAIKDFNDGKINLDKVIDAVSLSPKAILDFSNILKNKGNSNLLNFLKDVESFKTAPEEIKRRIILESEEGNQASTQLGTSIGGSIGSLVVANNDFSNIEKIAISTTTTTIGQNVGEYLYWTRDNNGSGAFKDFDVDALKNLQGAVVSFAISSYFSKNDNVADILGMDGTFIGGLADFTVSYTLGYYGSQAVSELFASLISINNIDYKNNKIFKNVA